jgi:WD40 repeat protein
MRDGTQQRNRLLAQAALIVLSAALLYSCSLQQEEKVRTDPFRLVKAVSSPGRYAYHAFYTGAFGNTIEVFDLESKESIGTIVPDEQKKIGAIAISPSEPRGILTLFEVPGNVYKFDLRNHSWERTTLLERVMLGVSVYAPREDIAWISVVGHPEILELNTSSNSVVATINLAAHFKKPLPHVALSPAGEYLAVLGTSPSDTNYYDNVSLVILDTRSRSLQSVVSLDAAPGNPVFTPDGSRLCIQDFSMEDVLLIDIQNRNLTRMPLVRNSVITNKLVIPSSAVDPVRGILVASLADPTIESYGPLNTLAVFDLSEKKMKAVHSIGVKVSQLQYQADGKVLYAVTPDGIAALDGDTFAMLYEIKSSLLNSSQGDRRDPRNYMPGKLVIQELK